MPEKLTCQLPFFVTASQRALLKQVSERTGKPQQRLMREALAHVLKQHKKLAQGVQS